MPPTKKINDADVTSLESCICDAAEVEAKRTDMEKRGFTVVSQVPATEAGKVELFGKNLNAPVAGAGREIVD